MGFVAEVLAQWADVALPVALLHDAIFVAIEGAGLMGEIGGKFGQGADDFQQPQGSGEMEHVLYAQLLLNQVAEGTAGVVSAVADEIGLSVGHVGLANG